MSDGYCEVSLEGYGEDSDPVQFYDSKLVTGRKAYACIECRGPIASGEQHRRISYRYEGKFSVDRICPPCAEASAEFEHRLIGGSLWEMFGEEWDNGARVQSCMERLTTARAKAKMQEQYNIFVQRRADQRRRMEEWRRECAKKQSPNEGA
jgi:hypothetical protein